MIPTLTSIVRQFQQETGNDSARIPLDLIAQAVVAAFLCIVGASERFKPVRPLNAAKEHLNKTMDNVLYREDTVAFSHRGAAVRALKSL